MYVPSFCPALRIAPRETSSQPGCQKTARQNACPHACARIMDIFFFNPPAPGPKPVSAPVQLAPVAESCVRLLYIQGPQGLAGQDPQ